MKKEFNEKIKNYNNKCKYNYIFNFFPITLIEFTRNEKEIAFEFIGKSKSMPNAVLNYLESFKNKKQPDSYKHIITFYNINENTKIYEWGERHIVSIEKFKEYLKDPFYSPMCVLVENFIKN